MRTCACGCGADLDALKKRRHARFASGACRARWSDAQRAGRESAEKAQTAPPRASAKQSGLQVSYRKAVDELVAFLVMIDYRAELPDDAAERILRGALSDRQRAQLDERS